MNPTERLNQMDADIRESRDTILNNLLVMESFADYIPVWRKYEFNETVRSSRIEQLRLNNALQSIKNLKHEIYLIERIVTELNTIVEEV